MRTVTGVPSLRALRAPEASLRAAASAAPSARGADTSAQTGVTRRQATWTRTASSLRARADPLQLAEGARTAPGRARGGTRTTARSSSVVAASTGTGPSTSAPSGRSSSVSASSTAPGSPVIVASRRGRRQVGLGPLGDLALGEAGRVPAHQRLQRRVVPGRRRRPPGRRAATSAGGVEPAAQRLLLRRAGRPGRAAARCRAARRRRTRPRPTGSAPGVATTIAGAAPTTCASTRSPPELPHRVPGKARPSSSAVRASPTHRRAQPAVAALGAGPGGVGACRTSGRSAASSGPASASGPGAGAAAGRGRGSARRPGRRVAGPRGLHQHRPARQRASRITS